MLKKWKVSNMDVKKDSANKDSANITRSIQENFQRLWIGLRYCRWLGRVVSRDSFIEVVPSALSGFQTKARLRAGLEKFQQIWDNVDVGEGCSARPGSCAVNPPNSIVLAGDLCRSSGAVENHSSQSLLNVCISTLRETRTMQKGKDGSGVMSGTKIFEIINNQKPLNIRGIW